MKISEKIVAIQVAVDAFGCTAHVANPDLVQIRNQKKVLCAKVTDAGVERLYDGQRVLCGWIVRDAIEAAIAEEQK